jgi:hypothetical protein
MSHPPASVDHRSRRNFGKNAMTRDADCDRSDIADEAVCATRVAPANGPAIVLIAYDFFCVPAAIEMAIMRQ